VFEASLANLSERGAFLRTGADLRFRDTLLVRVLELELRAEVLLVSEAPAGVVVTFLDPSASVRAVLAKHEGEVEVLPGQGVEPSDPWTEDTAASGDMEALPDALDGTTEEDFPQDLVKLATGDLAPVSESAADGLDPDLWAAAMMDDGLPEVSILDPVPAISHTEPGVEAFDPLEGPFDDVTNPQDQGVTAGRSPSEPPTWDSMIPQDTLPRGPEAFPALEVPVDDLIDEPITTPQPMLEPAPAPAAAADVNAPAAPQAQEALPTLDRDGYTVRFDSAATYTEQLQTHLRHGGLVVRAEPIAIGTQRMLALVVPGQAAYTVSARVIFHDQGKLGFMLDSFALHKNRLEQLAG